MWDLRAGYSHVGCQRDPRGKSKWNQKFLKERRVKSGETDLLQTLDRAARKLPEEEEEERGGGGGEGEKEGEKEEEEEGGRKRKRRTWQVKKEKKEERRRKTEKKRRRRRERSKVEWGAVGREGRGGEAGQGQIAHGSVSRVRGLQLYPKDNEETLQS